MKQMLSGAIVIILCVVGVDAQQPDTSLVSFYRTDYAVPDAPAFTLLDVSPSNVLRPSSVREAALALSSFTGSGLSFTVPDAFAAEIAPFLLAFGPELQLSQYNGQMLTRLLARTRVSIATRRVKEQAATSEIAVGLRVSVWDGSDLRTSGRAQGVRDELRLYLSEKGRDRQAIQDSLVALGLSVPEAAAWADSLSDGRSVASCDSVLSARITDSEPGRRTQLCRLLRSTVTQFEELDAIVKSEIQRAQEALWNAPTIELAAAWAGQGADSTGRGLRSAKWALWGTLGLGVGDWLQWLTGAQLARERDVSTDQFATRFSVSTRLYAGSNYFRFFAEGQLTAVEDRESVILLNSGTDLRIPALGWIQLTAGLERDQETDDWGMVTSFSYRLALPK